MVKYVLLCVSAFIVLCAARAGETSQDNNQPVVKIIDPINKSRHEKNNPIQYRIKVSDPEDGESEYDEIAANEVILEVKYVPDASKAPTHGIDVNGLSAIMQSNCFNCHAFNGKLIAPSFYEMAKRYPATPTNIELLAKRIREGSGGVWGSASMPTHSELTSLQARDIADWILNNGEDQTLNYYTGTEGTLRLKPPDGTDLKGAFILRAIYSDHGSKNNPQQKLSGTDVIIVYVK
jgi:cytochrome c